MPSWLLCVYFTTFFFFGTRVEVKQSERTAATWLLPSINLQLLSSLLSSQLQLSSLELLTVLLLQTSSRAMALKYFLFVSLLVAGMTVPMAEAQLGGLGGIVGGLLGILQVQGTVFCSANGNMGVNGTSTPVFPNAEVQMRCGGNTVASATTNSAGVFSILLDPLHYLLSSVLSNCNIVVNTPLSTCNSQLPGGGILSAPLVLIGRVLSGLLSIVNISPGAFSLLT